MPPDGKQVPENISNISKDRKCEPIRTFQQARSSADAFDAAVTSCLQLVVILFPSRLTGWDTCDALGLHQ